MMINFILTLWNDNKFFWDKSKSYTFPRKFRTLLYTPVAYFKFMKYSLKNKFIKV